MRMLTDVLDETRNQLAAAEAQIATLKEELAQALAETVAADHGTEQKVQELETVWQKMLQHKRRADQAAAQIVTLREERDALADAIARFRHTSEDRHLWETEDGHINIPALVAHARNADECASQLSGAIERAEQAEASLARVRALREQWRKRYPDTDEGAWQTLDCADDLDQALSPSSSPSTETEKA